MRVADIAAALQPPTKCLLFFAFISFRSAHQQRQQGTTTRTLFTNKGGRGILGRILRPEIVNNSRFFTVECGGGRLPSPLHCLLRRPALCVSAFLSFQFIYRRMCVFAFACERACNAGAIWTIIITDYYECKRPALSPLLNQHIYSQKQLFSAQFHHKLGGIIFISCSWEFILKCDVE